MAHVRWIGFVAFLASFGYCLFSGITDTGLLAWMSQMQRGWPGLSTENFRPIGILLTPALITWAAVVLARRLLPGEPRLPRWMTEGWGPFIATAALLAGFVWGLGMGFYRWSIQSDLEDQNASYVRVDDAAAPAALVVGAHVALVGQPLVDQVLEQLTVNRRTKSESFNHYLVPVAAPGWRQGQPLRYIVKVFKLDDLRQATAGNLQPLLGRVEGNVPDPVAQALARSGVALAEGAHLMRWIPSRDGQPLVTEAHEGAWSFAWIGSSAVSGFFVACVLLSGWAAARGRRRLRTQA